MSVETFNLNDLFQLLDAMERYSISAILTLIGFLLCLVAIYHLCRPNSPRLLKWLTLWPGIALVVGSQFINLINPHIERRVTPQQAFANLQKNERIVWLIRLIPYNPTREPYLALHNLSKLGNPEQDFVFVADYEELANYTVREAVYMTGGTLLGGRNRVSAIAFPTSEVDMVYPANARGVLQVIQQVQLKYRNMPPERRFELTEELTPAAFGALAVTKQANMLIDSWAWENWCQYYDEYNRAVIKFRDAPTTYSARTLMGQLNLDWHPAGYSMIVGYKDPKKLPNDFTLTACTKEGNLEISIPKFGARAFFVENKDLEKLPHRMMMDFTSPDLERIPDIRGKQGLMPQIK